MLLNRLLSLGLLAVLAGTFGCARNGGGLDRAHTGGLIGGTVGGAIGLTVGLLEAGVRNGEGAAMGFFAGGLLGTLVGHHMEMKSKDEQIATLKKERDALKAELDACKAENARLKAQIDELNRRIAELEARPSGGGMILATIEDRVLFAPGKAKLTADGRGVLDGLAPRVKEMIDQGKIINIEGHTDSQPIRHSGWRSNWELGAARALEVVHYYQDKHGIPGPGLSATTFSEYHPVAPNDSADNMSRNRRSVVVIYAGGVLPASAAQK